MSMWAPPDEKGKFTAALVGSSIGTVVTWPLAGLLIETIGWEFAFYVPAILAAGLTITWYLITFDSPAKHPRISQTERDYIEESLIGISNTKVCFILTHLRNLLFVYISELATPDQHAQIYPFLGAVPTTLRKSLGLIFLTYWSAKIHERSFEI